MDEHLRDLERRARTGDATARRALGHEHIRHGLGWHGEELPVPLAVQPERFPVYTFETGRGFSVEMLYEPALTLWIARRPTRWADYERWRTTRDGSTRTRRGPTNHGSGDDDPVSNREWRKASDFCQWIGCRLPRRDEIERARTTLATDGIVLPGGFTEWCSDGDEQRALTPYRAFVAGSGPTSTVRTNERSPDLGFRPVFPTGRDIDRVIAEVKNVLPNVICDRQHVSHPGADDDDLWFFRLPGGAGTVRVESPWGACPFNVWDENNELQDQNVAQTVARIVEWLGS
ncbi:MAG TPA: SUMF1/EgtB/PvdO family nonheme iron enzyme [Planctomycetota bacterium]|nr:SUMF1/EgtB/PvdO family nonheme iron enzyme [Planctomycetota bacterium]